ncbi:uncharacterized protein LOC130745048 [Lotus japonicus]|uniref:uncharacterized protein LOC130745048 n=1 Tax=Lotus japonicus TaxID=34305 RepID=UPI002590EA66|nr:uncharacterized protein LOC130745048 [Lotus japonicus]
MEDTFMFTSEPPPPPPPTPPDQQRPTFKDKVMGNGPTKRREPRQFQNLVTKGVLAKENVNGDRLFPSFDFVEESEYERICQPWQGCLVVKLLGTHIGYTAMCEKLRLLWKPVGGMEVTDVHHGYYMVKFDIEADRDRAATGVPWLIYDHYLSVKPWNKDFVAANDKINTTMVWIRIPGLGMQFYDEDILLTLATGVGTPIKVDIHTADMRLGKFARICVEIDLDKPVVGTLRLRGTWYNIEYEGLHLLCPKCGCYGHLSRKCKVETPTPVVVQTQTQTAAPTTSAPPEQTLGEAVNPALNADPMQAEIAAPKKAVSVTLAAHGKWLNVEKPKMKQNQNRHTGFAKSKEARNANRFQSLANLPEGEGDPVEGAHTPVKVGNDKMKTGTFNAKKRTRRDEGKPSLGVAHTPLRIMERASSHTPAPSGTGKAPGNVKIIPPTRMIGDKVVYDIGGGAMSTENMRPMGGGRYQLLTDASAREGCAVGEAVATNPMDPGPVNQMMRVSQQ